MIAERALALAGPDAVLAKRPTGVPHVYTGPLSPSGRFASAAGRTVCRARTRRLTVIPRDDLRPSLDPDARRLCARCSAHLSRSFPGTGGPGAPVHRDQWRRQYSDLTKADVAVALQVADTPAEVDAAGHLSVLLYGVAGCMRSFTDRGRAWPPLHQLTHQARARVGVFDDAVRAARETDSTRMQAAADRRAAERKQVWQDREDRIERLGFVNATAHEPPRRRRTS